MRNSRFLFIVLGVLGFVVQALEPAHTQSTGHDGHGTTLYVAALEGQQVVPPVSTEASGTGAFILKGQGNRYALAYDLTFQGLPKPPRRIVLRNFGEGGVGAVVHVVCGGDAASCAPQTGATLKGEWIDRLSPALARELAVGRVYIEIEDEVGHGVARGQILTYDSMLPVQGFIARLRSAGGAAAASGTGTFYLAHTRRGGQAIAYHITITGTDGTPTKALIVRPGAAGPTPRALLEMAPQKHFPRIAADPPAGQRGQRGGTIAGAISAPAVGASELFEKRLLTLPAEKLNVIIVTDANPAGELMGELIPVD